MTNILSGRLGIQFGQLLSWVVIGLGVAQASVSTATGRHDVRIDSSPSGADLYIVTFTTWEVSDGPRLMDTYLQAPDAASADQRLDELRVFLAPYREDQGPTPQTLSLTAHQYFVVALKGRSLGRATVIPRPNDEDDLTLHLRQVH